MQAVKLLVFFAWLTPVAAIAETPFERAEAMLRDQLRDPESAQFRHEWVGEDRKGRSFVCGEFNAKNGFGGYDGYRRFFVLLDGYGMGIEGADGQTFDIYWDTFCTRR